MAAVGAAGGQVWATGRAGRPVRVATEGGEVVAEGRLDGFGDRLAELGVTRRLRGRGGLVLRDLEPGRYVVHVGRRRSAVHLLPDDELPPDWAERVRGQRLDPGFGYLTTRDGTLLSVNVALPDPGAWGPGPHATLLQYSAYADSRPDALTGDPALDDSMTTELNVARHLGFAVVGLNARGSGASGGAFRMFDRIHGLDGYDAVEAIAAQPWCSAVGMVGRSGPGFLQLRVAATQPPSLRAITPASVLARSFGWGRRPGGLVNSWVDTQLSGWSTDAVEGLPDHAHRPRYDPAGRDAWVAAWCETRGDGVGLANQLLRGQTLAPIDQALVHADPAVEAVTAPAQWAARIRCATLLLGSWQDEESGPGWDDLVEAFAPDAEVCLLGVNGTHDETCYPELTALWANFLSERLRGEPLGEVATAEAYLRAVTVGRLGEHRLPIGPIRSLPRGRAAVVRLDNGAGPGGPGQPTAAATIELAAWPPPASRPRAWALESSGGLVDGPPAADGRCGYRYDPSVRPPSSGGRPGFDADAPAPDYDWRPLPPGFGLAFATRPLPAPLLLCGPSSLDLWLSADVADVDLEVTLTELRPDGWETFVQSGWLRTGFRRLDQERSSEARPVPTYRAEDVHPLPAGRPSLVRVPVPSVAHLLRAGSRLAVRVEPPGGVQPSWTFAPLWPEGRHDGEPVRVEVATGPSWPSRLVVTELPGVDLGHLPLPPPGALRRQPSRPSVEEGLDLGGDQAGAAVDGVVAGDVGAQGVAPATA